MTSKKAVQHGLERENSGKLQTLWLELPGYCNLACAYCYACGGETLDKARLLALAQYFDILTQAKTAGVDSVGIPGAGEPLIAANIGMTISVLRECARLGIYVTLFTTGEFITQQLAEDLFRLPVEIMLKGNTLDPVRQDEFVSDPTRGRQIHGYGNKRNRAINILMRTGFNDEEQCAHYGRKSRMALVTSIMTNEDGGLSNTAELPDILRFCRRNSIIFDCDSVLKQGRGASCSLCASDQQVKDVLLTLQHIDRDEFGEIWPISQSYVGTACDRYMHHLYINQYGDIRPCIGAKDVVLGNIRDTTLAKAWESREMAIIRSRAYHGKCGDECANFAEGKCNSCLGRRTANLNNATLLEEGCVNTIGCWNFLPKK